MAKLRFAEDYRDSYVPYSSPFGAAFNIAGAYWDDIQSGKPLSYRACSYYASVLQSGSKWGVALPRVSGNGCEKNLSAYVWHYSGCADWVDPNEQPSCVALTPGSGVPVLGGITGRLINFRKQAYLDVKGVKLSRRKLRKIAGRIWEACKCCKLIDSRIERGRVFAKAMAVVESREIVSWFIQKTKEGTLPRRLTPYQFVFQDVPRVFNKLHLVKASKRVKACFDCKDGEVVYVAPLYEKLSGTLLRRGVSRCSFEKITNAFVVTKQTSDNGSVGWGVYLVDNDYPDPDVKYYFGGRGNPEDKLDIIEDRINGVLVWHALGEEEDYFLKRALDADYRKVYTQRMSVDDALAMYNEVLERIDSTVRTNAEPCRFLLDDLESIEGKEVADILYEIFSTFYWSKK